MNPYVVAVNFAAIAVIGCYLAYRAWQSRQIGDVELPNAIRPSRPSQELADVVTEWAKVTGVLDADGSVSAEAADEQDGLTDERV